MTPTEEWITLARVVASCILFVLATAYAFYWIYQNA